MKRFAIVLLLIWSPCLRADVKLPNIFGDHMVLQRGMKVPIWGWADPGEKITVTVLDKPQTTTADDKGKWRITLDPINSGGRFARMLMTLVLNSASTPRVSLAAIT